MADPIVLVYRGTPGESVAVRGGFTTTLDVSGPPILTRQLTGTNPLLALQTYRVAGEGRRTVQADERGCAVGILYDHAHVEGIFGSKPFDFDVSPAIPENFKEDKLVEIAWGLAMGGRHYLLGPKGEYRPAKADAHGEALALLIDAPVRLSEGGVNVGQDWTTEWIGECTHKDTNARLQFRQTAVLQQLTDGSSPQAHITFVTSGKLNFTDKPSPQREETVLESKGTLVLDLKTGLPAMIETSGTMTTELKQSAVKLVRGTTAKYEFE